MSVAAPPARSLVLIFNPSNQLAVEPGPTGLQPAGAGTSTEILARHYPDHTPPVRYFSLEQRGALWEVHFTQISGTSPSSDQFPVTHAFHSLDELGHRQQELSPLLAEILRRLEPHLIDIPYLHLGENDYIYKFRVEKDRNQLIYAQDASANKLYQSGLCDAIKAQARTSERSATSPAKIDLGAVSYVIPSHFGFCLGVKNAIERAYESLAENPGKRVFMLSELIHNPFVNEDLLSRGLRYLQSDKGQHFPLNPDDPAGPTAWETLTKDDIVIIPAFGATDEDKLRLIRKGIRVAQYDATCMLVEKVWKAARAYGRAGYTIVIHGKHEHEETKATFSNSRRHAPSIVIRNIEEARLLGAHIAAPSESTRQDIRQRLAKQHTPDFDPDRHLDRIAVVNQTTLLMNETAAIIDYFRSLYVAKFGAEAGPNHVGGAGRKDTLCYATQVNQDALNRALSERLDAAFIIGGKNSSNTYQLYRLCEQVLGDRAFFIQSEANIRALDHVEHYVFPNRALGHAGHIVVHRLWDVADTQPKRILITGGASCPDGLIQQVIVRLNSFFPTESMRTIESAITKLQGSTWGAEP